MINRDLLVVIPAYNEEANVANVIKAINEQLPMADVLVVNDGSQDRTAKVASQAGAKVISLPYNMGYGAALQTGYKYARENDYQLLAQIDADGQHDPVYILDMLDLIRRGDADVVIGSRFLIDNGYRAPFAKRVGMLLFGTLASWVTGQKVSDPTSGYQALNRKAFCYCAGDVYPSDFADADVLIMLHRAGFRIREVSVRMYPSVNEQSRYLNMYSFLTPVYYIFKMSLTMFVTLLRERGGAERVVD
ncbi:MAG: glycosyltransferase family 2 protein [Anaerolineae bacterium]|nr:glycosyltransferase family 2 protein [Anaerolineae bacterium]